MFCFSWLEMSFMATTPGGTATCTDLVTSTARRKDYVAAGWWDEATLAQRVEDTGRRLPDRVAVIDLNGQRRISYGQLAADVRRARAALRQLGVRPGGVVAVQLPNWYETVVLDVAVLSLGCTLNAMLPIYRSRELRHMLGLAGTRVIATPSEYRRFSYRAMIDELRPMLTSLEHHITVTDPSRDPDAFAAWLGQFTEDDSPSSTDASAVSELLFTSGTEATPKAVMHTEHTTNFSVRAVASALGLSSDDVVWMPSPIGHSTGFNFGVRLALYHGLPLVLQDIWNPGEAADLISVLGCSYTVAATTFLRDLVHEAGRRSVDISSMRLFSCGGAPVPAELVRDAAELGVTVLRLYGSTEILIGSWSRPDAPWDKRVATDGIPFHGVEVEVRDEAGTALIGEPGEIFVRGPGTCAGFFADPGRTAATLSPDGWAATGDLGTLDEDGYLTVVGRKKEIIIRGGLNITPREVEDVATRMPQVDEIAVVGLPDPRLGEIACAFVVVTAGQALSLDELTVFLRGNGLAAYKLPERLELVDQLPKTLTGKVQKHLLAQAYGRTGI
jgi:cyclohexanecarboxylate-CoA ligase